MLGATLLATVRGLDSLPISEWLELLAVDNLDVVPAICEVVAKHVTPARLSLAQCIVLACARRRRSRGSASTGRSAKRDRPPTTCAGSRSSRSAGVASVRAEGTAWATR